MKIAVVTSEKASSMSEDDPILLDAIGKLGHEAFLWRWDDPNVDWQTMDIAILRSTWDYFEHPKTFLEWLSRFPATTKLLNHKDIITWNFNKKYLLELANAGIPVIPTQLCLHEEVEQAVEDIHSTGQSAIIKPAVSGSAWGLLHLKPGDNYTLRKEHEPWLVQPFVPSIITTGELSVIAINGQISHGIRKVPRNGDIRVQKEFGGQYIVEAPSQEAIEISLNALKVAPRKTQYARVDLVERAGKLHLMELELIEPELFFALVPSAANLLAESIVRAT